MHDKIKLLAEQALKSSMIHDEVYRPEGYANGVSKNFADKFAELIVQECINSIKVWRDASDDDMKNNNIAYWQGYQSGCDDGIIEIMQRFGIEE